jgi:Porin subfamily
MKMVKSLLLGSAAGLVAVAGAQAADLPVKAKPVLYVKICSLYGVGFYYIPGTDTCLKVGGWVRAEVNINAQGSFNPIVRDYRNRDSDLVNWRERGMITLDARSQTEYGTLRSYIAGAFQATNGTHGQIYAPRAFIQLAGFTVGLASSFFDFYATPWYSNTTNILGSDTGGGGQAVWAYTAQFGNGFSGSLSFEQPDIERTVIWRFGTGNPNTLGGIGNNYIGHNGWPEVVANLRVDQAWGSAQIMGAIHQVAANYYGATEASGHPNDQVGFAAGAGVKVNLPWGKGDSFAAQAAYSQGALKYVGSGLAGFAIWDGNSVGLGWVTDAVYSPVVGSSLELTTAWSVVAGIEHHWDPHWKTSLYGTYGDISYNGAATALFNAAICVTAACAAIGPDFQFWQVGSRTVWTPVQNLDLSVDVMYNQVQTAYDGIAIVAPAPKAGGAPSTVTDEGVWQVIFRAQRNFYP